MPDGDLLVYLHDELIGRLKSVRDGARFYYDSAYAAAHAGGVQLSTALTVREEPFDRESTRRWFAGLLPEDARLRELLRFFRHRYKLVSRCVARSGVGVRRRRPCRRVRGARRTR